MVKMPDLNALVDKARRVVSDNPDRVRTGLDKVSDVVNKTTGGKFKEQITKGSDMIGDALGAKKSDTVKGSVKDPESVPTMPTAPAPKSTPKASDPPADATA